MKEKEKKLFPLWINGQVPLVIWIDAEDDPWEHFEKGYKDLITYLVDIQRAVKNNLRELFIPRRPQLELLPPSPLEITIASSAAHCSVCGTGFDQEFTECLRCATPYHRECWNYVGKCSIFACESEKHI